MDAPTDIQRYAPRFVYPNPYVDEPVAGMEKGADGEYVRFEDLAPYIASLREQLAAAEQERDEQERNYEGACRLVALMHHAAVGEVTGAKRGVVEDVADLHARAERMAARIRDLEVAIHGWWGHDNDEQLWTDVFAAESFDEVDARLRALSTPDTTEAGR